MQSSLRDWSTRLSLLTILLLTVSLLLPAMALGQDQAATIDQEITKTMIVMHPEVVGHIDKLSDIRVPYEGEKEFGEFDLFNHPVFYPKASHNPDGPDGAMQLHSGPLVPGSVGLSFDGLGSGFTGPLGTFTVNSVPPDPNLAVGTTQMVQTVNSGFGIFDKTTGGALFGPYNIQVLWSALPAGSACTGSDGNPLHSVSLSDPVVSFDQMAQRWIISILALPYTTSSGALVAPFYHCIAYSTSADASAGWDVFQYNPGSLISGGTNFLPDYPKQGVWRDAYTFTYDMFNSTGSTYQGLELCGMDRNAILGGSLSPTIICFKTPNFASDYALLPATMDGSLYPPVQTSGTAGTDSCSAGSPCQPKAPFFEISNLTGANTTAYLYRTHFNFTTTSHSAVDTRVTITVASYNNTDCTNSQKCAVQPTHTGPLPSGQTFASESALDTLAAHAMWRAAYRNFSSFESVVFDQVARGSATQTAEVRWYEFRGINSSTGTGTPTVQQQSTFNPDSNATFRFMGSIAADHNNNMLMGYTGSSSTIFPSLYITGRLVGDAASTMETEQQVFAGLNSQVNITNYAYGYRWGDYSSMVIDPDDCTFWYTNEYLKQAGLFNWSTRVFNWNFGSANCTSLASITSPIPNAQGGKALTSATATFLWTPGTGTPTYTLAAGSTVGGNNYCGGTQSYGAGTYTATLSSCLPTDGSTFWVRLTTVPGGFQDYQYTAPLVSQPTTTTVTSSQNPSTYGQQGVSFTATVTAGSGTPTGTVQFVLDGNNFGSPVTLVSGSATSLNATPAVGTHTVAANYTPGSGFLASSGTLTGGQIVSKAVLTVTADNQSKAYGDNNPTLTYQMTGFVLGDNQGNSTTGQPSITTTATQTSPVGNYTITAALGTLAADNYSFSFVNGTLSIGQRNASVTPDPGTKVYGDPDPTLTGTLTGFLPADNVTATYGRTGGEWVAGNPYTISATLSPAGVLGNYNITYNTADFTITKRSASVTPDAAGKTYGQDDPTLTGTLSGFLPSDMVTATYSRDAGEGVGHYTISATLSANPPQKPKGRKDSSEILDNYNITYNTAQFTISAAVLSVTAGNTGITYGCQCAPVLTYNITGFQFGDNQGNSTTGQPAEYTNGTQNGPVGNYPIFISQGTLAAANYSFAFVNGNLTVGPATLTVTADNKTITAGSDLPTFTASYGGFVNGDNQGVVSGSPSLTTDAPNNPPVGTYNIFAAQGTLAAQNYIFSFVNGTLNVVPGNAQITAPAKNSMLSGASVQFTWSQEYQAVSYTLNLGTTPGGSDIASVTTANLNTTVNGLPTDGSYIYATLLGSTDGSTYTPQDTALYVANSQIAVMINPLPSTTFSGTSVIFNWVGGAASSAYWIDAGSYYGGNDYYQSGNLGGGLTATINTFPSDGSTVYVTLWSLVNGQWFYNEYTYTAYNNSSIKGTMTSPTPGSQFAGTTVTFTWSAGTESTAYWLDAGSTPGGNQYYQSGNLGNVLTTSVNNLPSDGSTVYITLWSLVNGNWVNNQYQYTAYSAQSATGQIYSPTPGSTFTGTTVTFNWSAGTGSSAYWLDVGSTPGGNQYYQSGNLGNVLTTTVNNLPSDGSTVYVTLYSLVGGQWLSHSYTYTAYIASSGKAVMQTPIPSSTINGPTATFTWSAGSADNYWLDIGSAPGGNDYYQSGPLGGGTLSTVVSTLPANNSTIYVTLWSHVAGQWVNNQYTYTSAP